MRALEPRLERIDVLPGAKDSPPVHVKVRCGKVPSADTLLLVVRRIYG